MFCEAISSGLYCVLKILIMDSELRFFLYQKINPKIKNNYSL